ncbi:hypothetical protein P154DRAFT_583468 [Amniculicola lignicola CBS 123094]|uniref:Uncharacterized protein n=1 Tax=Amniculicola lignicola CBS 123094 TaxID=1392246 RepID=A0A6A5W593_9PLEO|nr:hypothetical protein P154DRAFT_583468 [Amniculicola lignicola CBS 123094]
MVGPPGSNAIPAHPQSTALVTFEEMQQAVSRGCGAYFEAYVFATLFHLSHIIRSFEFAPVDGALDCSQDSTPNTSLESFGNRFWELNEQIRDDPHLGRCLLVPFDVKSTVSFSAEDQIYITTLSQ